MTVHLYFFLKITIPNLSKNYRMKIVIYTLYYNDKMIMAKTKMNTFTKLGLQI